MKVKELFLSFICGGKQWCHHYGSFYYRTCVVADDVNAFFLSAKGYINIFPMQPSI